MASDALAGVYGSPGTRSEGTRRPLGSDAGSASSLTDLKMRSDKNLNRLGVGCNGRSDRHRTCNLRFWRPTLYRLSYTPANLISQNAIKVNCFY